jgi:cell wall-associated NlpC family hydrolase
VTIGSVDLTAIQQTLSEMQQATAPNSEPTGAGGSSFAASLAQATSALSPDAGLSGTGGDTLFGQESSGLTGDSSGEVELLSLLLSAQGGGDGVAAPAAGSSSGSVNGQDVVSEASQFEGTPYVWGGTSPQGFDCSGLTQYVYAQLGIQLPRTSEMQATVGSPVGSLAAAQPGDLVFFAGSDGTANSPGHVGIYIGNGQMIDAPHTGSSVEVQPVSSAGPVVAIRRVLPSNEPGNANVSGNGTVMGNVTVPAQYVSTIEQAASSNGIPASLLAALLSHESRFNPTVVSSAGAEGIAQFMPATAAGMGINPDDPTEAINAAAQLLGSYTTQFGSYADALAAYDAGASAVERYGGIPPYAETQAYVPAVLSMAGLTGTVA